MQRWILDRRLCLRFRQLRLRKCPIPYWHGSSASWTARKVQACCDPALTKDVWRIPWGCNSRPFRRLYFKEQERLISATYHWPFSLMITIIVRFNYGHPLSQAPHSTTWKRNNWGVPSKRRWKGETVYAVVFWLSVWGCSLTRFTMNKSTMVVRFRRAKGWNQMSLFLETKEWSKVRLQLWTYFNWVNAFAAKQFSW